MIGNSIQEWTKAAGLNLHLEVDVKLVGGPEVVVMSKDLLMANLMGEAGTGENWVKKTGSGVVENLMWENLVKMESETVVILTGVAALNLVALT